MSKWGHTLLVDTDKILSFHLSLLVVHFPNATWEKSTLASPSRFARNWMQFKLITRSSTYLDILYFLVFLILKLLRAYLNLIDHRKYYGRLRLNCTTVNYVYDCKYDHSLRHHRRIGRSIGYTNVWSKPPAAFNNVKYCQQYQSCTIHLCDC